MPNKDVLRTKVGGYAMLAIDQRGSLINLMQKSKISPPNKNQIIDFKFEVLKSLGTLASAVLIDIDYGIPALKRVGNLESKIILAVDLFEHAPDGSLESSEIDSRNLDSFIQESGAEALKFLLLWKIGESNEAKLKLVDRFMNLCEKHNLISVLESVVKPNPSTGWKSEIEKLDSMFESADEISKFQPDIYKCEVPGWGKFTKEKLIASSEEISRLIKGDWVVLSNGTAKADFFDSVETTFSAGASGFLAGRAIWAEALESSDSVDFLNDNSLQFFKKLTKIVEKKQQ